MMDIERRQAGMARAIRMVGMIIQQMMDIERGQAGMARAGRMVRMIIQ